MSRGVWPVWPLVSTSIPERLAGRAQMRETLLRAGARCKRQKGFPFEREHRRFAAELIGRVAAGQHVRKRSIDHELMRADRTRIARTPLGRLGTVEDIAQSICFLASDQSGFITAQALTVDGGITLTNI